jgi:hypothetical protein
VDPKFPISPTAPLKLPKFLKEPSPIKWNLGSPGKIISIPPQNKNILEDVDTSKGNSIGEPHQNCPSTSKVNKPNHFIILHRKILSNKFSN